MNTILRKILEKVLEEDNFEPSRIPRENPSIFVTEFDDRRSPDVSMLRFSSYRVPVTRDSVIISGFAEQQLANLSARANDARWNV